MKPIKLTLCGWGPYKDKQEIDFEKFNNRGLFLITGATGAGKTTIFDGIAYALYGNMSGMVREKSSVRSDFAKADTPTYVELSMTHAGEQYHIYRNPEYLRPKKRKTASQDMTKEKERAVLTLPTGETVEGSSEVNRKIQELLRLDYRQFKQLSLIAQGEFAKMLTATSSEKTRIFREIFNTEIYEKMTSELRIRSGTLYKQVMEYRHKMEEDVSFFIPGNEHKQAWQELVGEKNYRYEQVIDFLNIANKQQEAENIILKQEVLKAEKQAEEAAALYTECERITELFDKLEKEQIRKESLALREKEVAILAEKLKQAEKALVVYRNEQEWKMILLQLQEMKKATANLKEEIKDLQQKQNKEKELYEKRELLENAYEEEEKNQEAKRQKEQCDCLFAEQRERLSRLQQAFLDAEQKETEAKREYESADRTYRHAVAGILASELAPGMPCPVCGSTEHPQKAGLSENMPTKDEVDEKKKAFERCRMESERIHLDTAVCREKTDAIRAECQKWDEDIAKYTENRKKRDPFVLMMTDGFSKKQYEEKKVQYQEISVRLQEKSKLLIKQEEEVQIKTSTSDGAKKQFMEMLAEKNFGDEAEYRLAFLEEEEINRIREEIFAHREEVQVNEQLIAHIQKQLEGKEKPDALAVKEALEEAKEKRDVIREQYVEKTHYERDIKRLMVSLKEKLVREKQLEEEYGMIKKLEDAASGNNRLRLVFEQYVLAAYFEEILKAANIRLRTMSMGRYELKRAESVGDGRTKDSLEMEVYDYYTGKYRSVKTLSGGETFKTSLALALGMSDIVQTLSGGLRVEALFIDEGFGSLDSESLEQACLTLQSLVEKDRLIGIISHVPELSERINNQIRIRKTNVGSDIEVVVS